MTPEELVESSRAIMAAGYGLSGAALRALLEVLDARGKEIERIYRSPGMKLFLTQAVTVSKYGSDVKVACDGPDDAKVIFEFLANLGAMVDGRITDHP